MIHACTSVWNLIVIGSVRPVKVTGLCCSLKSQIQHFLYFLPDFKNSPAFQLADRSLNLYKKVCILVQFVWFWSGQWLGIKLVYKCLHHQPSNWRWEGVPALYICLCDLWPNTKGEAMFDLNLDFHYIFSMNQEYDLSKSKFVSGQNSSPKSANRSSACHVCQALKSDFHICEELCGQYYLSLSEPLQVFLHFFQTQTPFILFCFIAFILCLLLLYFEMC